jgi:predicted Zn finger-like uncharacterized protein
MIIECPSCGARAKLPDSKAGAKVRCSECERVYLARPVGTRGPTKSRSSAMPITIGAVVVVLIVALIAINNRGSSKRPAPAPTETEEVAREPEPLTGWDAPVVKFAREVHATAAAGDELDLQRMLAEDRVWARIQAAETGEEVDPAAYQNLDGATRMAFVDGVLKQLTSDDPENLVGAWVPFSGEVLEETDKTASVRLTLRPEDATDTGQRNIDWKLVKEKGNWRAWSWERYISPEELAAMNRRISPSKAKKTLSDGSVVYEAETTTVDWMPETTPEERQHIEGLIAQMVDYTTRPAPRTEAQDELRAIGKPAVPGLLNKFKELDDAGWDDLDAVSAGQALHMTLMDITGYVTTFNPHEAMGGTDERRESGVRQWFYWYARKFDRFQGKEEETDLLEEDWKPTNEAEQREYDKYKKLIESENDNEKP